MTGALLTRRIQFVAIAAVLISAASVVTVRADPVSVTSGIFVLPDDDPSFFQFFGADGFVLGGLFIPTPISPHRTCVRGGCTPGTNVDMSAVAGGDLARDLARTFDGSSRQRNRISESPVQPRSRLATTERSISVRCSGNPTIGFSLRNGTV
jgi:hypothetical protein